MAQKWGLPVDEVLPQTSLKLKTEPYYHFLYLEWFLSGQLSPQSFLEEIRTVAKNNLATRIYHLSFDPQWKKNCDYLLLDNYDLLYLTEFLEEYWGFINRNERNSDLIN